MRKRLRRRIEILLFIIGEEILSGANVIDGYLRGVVGGHIIECSDNE